MKKILSILLVIAMLLPYGMTANAIASETETIEVDPFYFVNASANVDNLPEALPYTYRTPMFWATANASHVYYDGHPAPEGSGYGSYDIEWIAKELKETFDNQPEGTRFIDFRLPREAYLATAENIVYLDNATILIREWVNAFLAEYSRIGGKLDGFLLDTEYENDEAHMMWKRIYTGYYDVYDEEKGAWTIRYQNTNIYKDIVNDPRYATEIRPMLVERGFKFWPNPTGDESEIWGINYEISENEPEYSQCDEIWNAVMQIRLVESLNESVYEPLMKYYPDAIVSDYQTRQVKTWLNQISDYGNAIAFNAPMMGNATNYSSYNNRIRNNLFGYNTAGNKVAATYSNITGYNKAIFANEPFTMTMWETNMFKLMYEAADTKNINAWITSYNGLAGDTTTCNNKNTPYYTESLYHMGLLGMDPFIGYIINSSMIIETDGSDTEEQIAEKKQAAANKALGVASEIMAELTRVAGMSDREPILVPASWNGGYVLSGMYAGGRNIWRITPNTEIVSLENFKVAGQTAPTFSIDGQTITFPQGRIIADSEISVVGSCGYWVETPADVKPVITSVDNRYAEYPAYEENFEQYTAGTALSSKTALPEAVWETSGSATVEADGNNKVLVINTNTTLTNVKLPQNITAGDSYAKQQGWEVTVTIPEVLSPAAELYLLSCAANDGFKVVNGKVYYAQNGSYVELSGVSLSADAAYTFKREVDFRTAGAYKSSYSVYGSTGALIAEVKDVAMGNVTIPVTAIEISCKYANGNILIDNYKLYPTGVTTDMSVYDARLGTKLDLNATRTEDTAYRVAWMNTTNETKIAIVYNALDNNEIARIEMAPGQDGYATGVVKASADAPVKLAVKTEDGETATHPDYNDGDFNWPKWSGNTLSGTVTSNGDAEDVITLELLSGTSVVKTMLIPGNGGAYEFANLQMGEYTLRATKANQCKACTAEYTINLTTNTAVQDVAIYSYTVEHKEATCKENGSDTYTCANCGHSYIERTEALAHTEATRRENEQNNSYDMVTYCTVCNTVLSRETVNVWEQFGPARFLFTDSNQKVEPTLEVIINQGDDPVYLYATGSDWFVKEGAGASDYNIKITYNDGENPKLYLNKAHISAYGDGSGYPVITIGSATDAAYNNVSVDVIAENGACWLSNQKSYAEPVIMSYIEGALTISSERNGRFNIGCDSYGVRNGDKGYITAKGDLIFKNAKIDTSIKFATRPFFRSVNGNIIVDGGTLTITKKGDAQTNYGSIFQALTAGKKILVQNGANVTFTDTIGGSTVFDGVTEIKDATVGVTFTTTGVIFSQMPTLNFAESYTATADGSNYDHTNFETVLLNGYDTIQNFAIAPVELPKAQFAIATSTDANAVAEPIEMTQGDEPIYLKTVQMGTTSTNVALFAATTEGAGEGDYDIMITFNEGENPTLTLNGAKFVVAEGNKMITIGSATTSAVNNLDYDIVITDKVEMSHWTGWSHAFIDSYTKGDLNIKGNGNALNLTHYIRKNSHSMIQAVGDVNLVDVNVTMGTRAEHEDTYANYITSTTGNINVSGGSLTTTTERYAYIGVLPRTAIAMLNAPAGAVAITDGANVKISVDTDAKGINALNGITIEDSYVTITAPNGTLYSAEPTLKYTDPRYVLTKEEGSYAVAPHTPPYMQFTFSDGLYTANLVKVITEGDAPIYLRGVNGAHPNGTKIAYLTDEGVTEDNWTVMISFPVGGKATLTLNGATIINGEGGHLVAIGYKDGHAMNNQDVVIDVIKNSRLAHAFSWSSPNIACYATGDLIINGKGGKLEMVNWSHATGSNTLIQLSGIYAAGDVKLLDLDLSLSYMGGNADTNANMINCPNGDITVSGGKLTVTTGKFKTAAKAALNAPAGAVAIENGTIVNITVQQANTGIVAGNGITIKDSSVTITAPEGTLYSAEPVPMFSGEHVLTNEGGVYSIKPAQSPVVPFTFNQGSTAPLNVEVKQGGDDIYLKVVDGVVVLADGEADATIKLTYPTDGNPQIVLNGAVINMLYEHGAGIVIGDENVDSIYNNLNVDVVVKGNSIIKANDKYSSSAIVSYISGTLTVISDGGLLEIDSRMALAGGAISAVSDVEFKNAQVMMYSGWDEERGEYIRSENGNIVINGGMLQIMTNGRVTENVGYKLVNAVNGNITIENGANVMIFTDRVVTVFAAGEEGTIAITDSAVQLATDNANAALFNKQPVLTDTNVTASTELTNVVLGDATEFGGNYFAITKPGTAGAYNENAWNTYKYFSAAAITVNHVAGNAVVENSVAATCTNDGSYDEVVYCSVCGEELSRTTVVVSALGHNYNAALTAPTCTAAGYTTYTCSVCGDTYTEAGEPATGHTAGEVVVENFKDSDLNDEGSYDNVIYCTVCGAEISREAVTIPVKTGAVAELNGVKYATLAEAVNVANGIKTPCEIKLLANSRGDGLTFRREVTVDFGSYYYIALNFATNTTAAVRVAAGATVTFTGTGTLSTLTADREKFSTLIVNSGNLIIDGIKVNGNNLRDPNFNNYYAIRNLADDATVQILSGSVTAANMAAAYTVNLTGTTTKAADVEIKIPTHWCWVNGTTLSHEHNYTVTFVGATLETAGGYVHECQGCGYVRMTNTYNYYRGVARVGEYYYRTLQEAIDNANGGEVVLVKNVTIDVLDIKESVTINQDRYHIIVNVSPEDTPSAAVTIASGATLTLKGTTGKLTNRASTSKQFDTLILNEGTFILDGVTLRADYLDKADECYVVAGNGTVEFLSGGVIMNQIPTNGIPGAA